MRGVHLHIRGFLDHDPLGTWCGARVHCEWMTAQLSLTLRSLNENDPQLMKAIENLRAEGFQFISVSGHSFGGHKAHDLVDQHLARSIDCLATIDECPPLEPVGWQQPPRPFTTSARFGYACWQHNSAPTGIMRQPRGTAVVVEDCTAWTGPRLGHVDYPNSNPALALSSIAGDSRVWFGKDGRPGVSQQVAAALDSRL